MKQKMKRYLGIVFSLVLVLGLMPCMGLTAYAQHSHSFNYEAKDATEAEDATITATCTDDTCEFHNTPIVLTLSASDATYTGSAYTGASLSDTTAWTGAGLTAPTIEYEGRGSTTYTKKEEAPTNAGEYTASITVEGETASANFTIARKEVGLEWSNTSLTYNKEQQAPTATATGTFNGDVISVTVTGQETNASETPYTATATALTGDYAGNYALPENKTTQFTIAKANVTITAKNQKINVGDPVPTLEGTDFYTVDGLVGNDTLTKDPTLVYNPADPDNTKTGTYAIVPSGATANENYNISYTNGTLTISNKPSPAPQPSGKTNPTVTAPTAKDLTYTGQAQELVNAGKADGGTMEYALGTDDKTAPTTGWSTTVPSGKDAGNYFVWYRVKGDASHNDVAAKCVPATIAAAADKEVADVISKIDALPEKDKVQESDKAAIEAARAAFDALTDEEKAQVPADELKKLTDAEEALKAFEPEQPTVYMRAHVENRGWDAKTTPIGPGTSDYVGTTGQGLRLEAFDMVVPENYKVTGFAHVQNVGDSNVTKVDNPEYDVPKGYTVYRFGTTGRGLRMEAVEIHLLDENDKPVEGFQYASHMENIGWEGYVNNGSFSGTRGRSLRLEALRFAYPEANAADTQQ